MKLRTELNIAPNNFFINHNQSILTIGSCFAKNIGSELSNAKFNVLQNPFGTLFHPIAIENALARICTLSLYTEEEIVGLNGLYFSWDHHSSFNKTTVKSTLDNINKSLEIANNFIRNTNVVILTYGTAWAYKLINANVLVANCHKVPSHYFEKVLLTDLQLKTTIKNTFDLILDVNPQAKIITTISPVRHIKNGLIENNVSKAKLISNLHEVQPKYNNANYFPAYELLLDDLRDYRFYADDLLHPNQLAINYIWEKFTNAYFDNNTQQKIKSVQKINSAVKHKAFNVGTIAHKEFIYNTLKQIESLETQFPKNAFINEKEHLQKQLNVD